MDGVVAFFLSWKTYIHFINNTSFDEVNKCYKKGLHKWPELWLPEPIKLQILELTILSAALSPKIKTQPFSGILEEVMIV